MSGLPVVLSHGITVERVKRSEDTVQALAHLRMTVFRDWPYLYDGTAEYEASYLSEFLDDETAILIVARSGDNIVGMATASALRNQSSRFQEPFSRAGLNVNVIHYFGESVLLPELRGLGIGHAFFDQREAGARSAGATEAVFCALERGPEHPRRPSTARDLSPFWTKRGFRQVPWLETSMSWHEVGQSGAIPHRMRFWMRRL